MPLPHGRGIIICTYTRNLMNLVKESLAKLLAQEDLIVEHRQVSTAQFNVDTRVLTLPTWNHSVNAVTDLLIAHEVGHALYTPNEWDYLKEIPQQFVNVCEDIRIEKLMKRRYAGLPKTFYAGYETLADEDFFQIEDIEWSKLNLADKLNVFFKIGNFSDVPFSEEEVPFRDKASKLETFEDVLELAKEVYTYCKGQMEQDKKEQEEKGSRPNLGQDNTEYEDGVGEQNPRPEEDIADDFNQSEPPDFPEGEDESEGLGEEGKEKPGGEEAGRGDGSNVKNGEPTVKTADNLEEAIKHLVKHSQGRENVYVELPPSLGKSVIISNKEVSEILDNFYQAKADLETQQDFSDEHELHMARYYYQSLKECDNEYNKFKTSNNKEVSYLVKEFECRKAASSYARASINRTGVLDTTKLHTYRYNEDIFKKVTTLPQGKNHGLIFNLDWSGSMHSSILATVKQLITLVSFCRKVGIAYDVYMFTDAYRGYSDPCYDFGAELKNKVILKDFSMVNVLSSSVNNRRHEKQIKNFWRLAYSLSNRSVGCPNQLGMGGTPLNEAMISMNYILPEFKSRTGAEKVHVISLTDGEGYPCGYGNEMQKYDNTGTKIWRSNINADRTFLRDRKTGRTYTFEDGHYQTGTFVSQLRDRFPECEFMNIYLLGGQDWNRFKRLCMGRNYEAWEDADRVWRKTKSFICTTSYWTVQYALSVGALNNDAEFEVQDDATKAQIKKAFTKSLGAKKMNKKILSSFIERIA